MRNSFRSLIAAAAVAGLSLCATPAKAADDAKSPWGLTLDATYASAFVGNGIIWVDGPVLEPSVTASYTFEDHKLALNYWVAVNLNDVIGFDNPKSASWNWTEWDLTPSYTYSGFEYVDLTLGYTRYQFVALAPPGNHTQDVWFQVAFKKVFLNPVLTYYYDIDADGVAGNGNRGSHGTVAISHDWNISDVTFTTFGGFGLADDNYGKAYFSHDGQDRAGFTHYWLGIKKSFEVTKHFTITPSLTFTQLINQKGVLGATYDTLKAGGFSGTRSENLAAAVSLAYTF